LNTLEIILPLRNPTPVIEQTVKSLATQTDRRFAVLLSDNFSTHGGELIAAAAGHFEAAGIPVRRVRPPYELGRVEHWNWAHFEAHAAWLKPVFAGDWLEPDYVAKLRAAALANPACRYVYSSYTLHRVDEPPQTVTAAWAGQFRAAAEMERIVLRYGMQFGPPSAAAYERTAFAAVGGYPTALPICSDSLMFCALASRFGALGFEEALCHFNIHGARFSTNLPKRRQDTFRETLTYLLLLGYGAWAARVRFSKLGYARMLAREIQSYRNGK
jgi:glycosyltransferase involved in cell wall biosynthesis